MTGAQLRSWLERRDVNVNAFQQKATDAYVRIKGDAEITREGALRTPKRWLGESHRMEEINPGPDWRAAVKEVLGVDPFEAPSPWALLDLLESTRAMVVNADKERQDLLGRIAELEGWREQSQTPRKGRGAGS